VEDEVTTAVRQQGIASMEEVEAVILESDGTIAIVSGGNSESTALTPMVGVSGN